MCLRSVERALGNLDCNSSDNAVAAMQGKIVPLGDMYIVVLADVHKYGFKTPSYEGSGSPRVLSLPDHI